MAATTSVGLLDQLLAESTNKGQACSVCTFLQSHPDPDWPAIMAHPKISTRVIHAELARRGYDHTESPVKTHRTAKHGLS